MVSIPDFFVEYFETQVLRLYGNQKALPYPGGPFDLMAFIFVSRYLLKKILLQQAFQKPLQFLAPVRLKARTGYFL